VITVFGFKPNAHSLGLIENHITVDALFEDISWGIEKLMV